MVYTSSSLKSRSSHPEMFYKKVFFEISQNSHENTCARVSFLIKLQRRTLLKKRLWHMCFPANFAIFLGTFFFNASGGCF